MFSVANTTCAAYVSNRLNMFVCVNMCWEITNNSHLMHMLIHMFDLNIGEAYVAHFAVNMVHIEWMLFLAVALE